MALLFATRSPSVSWLALLLLTLGACDEVGQWKPPIDLAVADLIVDQSASDRNSAPDAAPDRAGPDLKPDTHVEATIADMTRDPTIIGCSDGTREGFLNHIQFVKIAACAGAWTIVGAHNTVPACARASGNDGTNPKGTGCNVTDLCATGWHVCFGKVDVLSRNPLGCVNIMDGGAKTPAFYLARTSSTGAFNCSQDSTLFGDPGTSNDLFGCGDLGCQMVQGTCSVGGVNCNPLKDCTGCPTGQKCANASTCTPSICYPLTTASHDLCSGLRNDGGCGAWCNHLGKHPSLTNNWYCGTSSTLEANNVSKSDATTQGGVLCCQD